MKRQPPPPKALEADPQNWGIITVCLYKTAKIYKGDNKLVGTPNH